MPTGDELRVQGVGLVLVVLGLAACLGDEPVPTADDPTPSWPVELELRVGALDDPVYSLTAIRGMEIGPDGSIYTLHPSEAMAETATWLLLDPDGEPMGEVELPTSVLIRQFELPILWGVETDDFDVPYVVRYRVETSMIARGDPGTGATFAASRHVTRPRSQPSRGRRGGSSHDIAEAA